MSLLGSVRRLGAPVIGVLGAAALCVACSSSSAGTPDTPAPTLGSQPASTSSNVGASTPAGAPTSAGDLTTASGPHLSGAPFCTEFNTSDLSGLASGTDLSKVLAAWDKFTAEAPSEIKPDFQKVDDYLHSASGGKAPNAEQTQELSTAGQHIGQWLAQNCTGG